jgi:hypothetical protein
LRALRPACFNQIHASYLGGKPIAAADREHLTATLLTMKANLIQINVPAIDSAQQ